MTNLPVGPLVAPLNVVDDDGPVHPKVDFVPRPDVDLGLVLGPFDVRDAVERIVREVAGNRQPLPGLNRYDLVRICEIIRGVWENINFCADLWRINLQVRLQNSLC